MRLGQSMPEEQRVQDSISHMGNTIWVGRHHSEKTKAKISAAHMGKTISLETRAKMSAAHKGHNGLFGHHPSPETRAKLSVARRAHPGSPCSLDARAKISSANKGRVITPEWQAKITAALWRGGVQAAGRRSKAKRRLFGFVPLNSFFPGSEGHHVDNEQVIYMPKALHRSVYHNQHTGAGMAKINAIAYNFLFKQEVEAAIRTP